MNKYVITVIIIVIAFLGYKSSVAGEQEDAKASMYYLKDGIGARASALGNGFVAVANDVSSVYWNPAELSNFDNTYIQFITMYYVPAPDSSYIYGAVAQRLENDYGGAGIFWHNFTIGGLSSENRENVFGISYGKTLFSVVSAGLNIKYYYQIVNNNKYNSIGFDVAGSIKPFGSLLKLSGSITDIGAIVTTPTFRAGVSYPFIYKVVLASMDISKTLQKPFKLHVGMEIIPINNFYFIDNVSMRFGLDDLNLSTGLGVNIDKYSVDYSYTNNQQTFSYTHRLSLIVLF